MKAIQRQKVFTSPWYEWVVVFFTIFNLIVISSYITAFLLLSTAHGDTCSGHTYYDKCLNYLQLFGQTDYTQTSRSGITAYGVYHSSGIHIDQTSTPNKVYVVDRGNNRILAYNGVGYCSGTKTACTTDNDCGGANNSCVINGTKPADIVIGQKDFSSATCNGDNNFGYTLNPSSTSLCLLKYPATNNTAESWMRLNTDTDTDGNLYILDIVNNRVLKYNKPFSADKSDGNGDTIADFVWGQDTFTTNILGTSQTTLRTSASSIDAGASMGVSVDQKGNVWVADAGNSRILRFPPASDPNAKVANLVIGQLGFDLFGCYDVGREPKKHLLDKLCFPTLAKINPSTGELYVLDEYPSPFLSRILVFKPDPVTKDFVNGMKAYKVIIPQQKGKLLEGDTVFNTFKDAGACNQDGCYTFQSTGFTFNPFYKNSSYPQYAKGVLWVTEHQTNRVLLIDNNGNILATIGTPDFNHRGGDSLWDDSGKCGNIYTSGNFNLSWPGGSVAFDSQNNIYLADEEFGGRISRYTMPYTLSKKKSPLGLPCLPITNQGLFPGGSFNVVADDVVPTQAPLHTVLGDSQNITAINRKLGERIGLALFHDSTHNQLILQDENHLKIWNDYLIHAQYGDPPDYIIPANGSQMSAGIDNTEKLWRFNQDGWLQTWQLPFNSNDQKPTNDYIQLYWNTNSGSPSEKASASGTVAFDSISKAIYVADIPNNRILRVKNYDKVGSENLIVDMVIGQSDKTTVKCNHTQNKGLQNPIPDDGLCLPTQIKFDNYGNLYVIENAPECHGNDRISMFTADDIKNAQYTDGVAFGLKPKKAFVGTLTEHGPCGYETIYQPGSPISIAFDSKNRMIVGNDGYYGDKSVRQLKQLWIYNDPLLKDATGNYVTKQLPDYAINLPVGTPGEIVFDRNNNDNLLIQDYTWYRVWGINLNTDPVWLIPNVPNTPTPTRDPLITPTNIPTPTPFSFPTSIPNIISWKTPRVSIRADGFYLKNKFNYYYANKGNTVVTSQYISPQKIAMQIKWTENSIEIFIKILFSLHSSMWKTNYVRVTINNGTELTYDGYDLISGILGQPFTAQRLDLVGSLPAPFMHFDNVSIQPFINSPTFTPTPTPN